MLACSRGDAGQAAGVGVCTGAAAYTVLPVCPRTTGEARLRMVFTAGMYGGGAWSGRY